MVKKIGEAAVSMLWMSIHPLRKTGAVWGWIGLFLTIFIVFGLVGSGLAAKFAPSPLPDPSLRWPLIIAYPATILAFLFFIAGSRLRYRDIINRPNKELLEKLMEFLRRGQSLFYSELREHPEIDRAIKDWDSNYDLWYGDVTTFLEFNLTALDVHAFKDNRGVNYDRYYPRQINGHHSKRLSDFETELDNLVQIISRFEVTVNP